MTDQKPVISDAEVEKFHHDFINVLAEHGPYHPHSECTRVALEAFLTARLPDENFRENDWGEGFDRCRSIVLKGRGG